MNQQTTAQVATQLGLSIRTIQRRCANGQLNAVKINRRWVITLEDTMTDLPQLDVTPEQAPFANRDRDNALARLDAEIRTTAGNQPAELVDQLAAVYREVALRHTNWGWWSALAGRHIGRVVQRELTDDDKARIAQLASQRH